MREKPTSSTSSLAFGLTWRIPPPPVQLVKEREVLVGNVPLSLS